MRHSIPLYMLTAALLAAAVYLKSPVVAVSVVVLWGFRSAEDVLTRKNKDADITELQAAIAAHKSKLATVEQHIANIADRASTLLGETF